MLTSFSNSAPRICRLGMMPGPYIPERSEERIGRIHRSRMLLTLGMTSCPLSLILGTGLVRSTL